MFRTYFQVMNSTVEQQLNLLSENHDISYLRLQLDLDKPFPLDNTNPNDLDRIEKLANEYFDLLLEHGLREKLIEPLRERIHRKRAPKASSSSC